MTRASRVRRLARWLPLLVAVALVVPASSVRPAAISLTTVERASAVDFGDGVLWVLALGSDARPGQELTDGHTDAIQLIGINWRTGHAVAIGIPRDSWVRLPDGMSRINNAVIDGGTDLAAHEVAELVDITPDLVLMTGFDGFQAMLGTFGEIEVDSAFSFPLPEVDLRVREGRNTLTPREALAFARSRDLPGYDFARSAHHQQLLLGALRELRARADSEGFMEGVALAAIGGLETDLSPGELYRFVHALTLVDAGRVTACVIGGTPGTEFGASVVYPDRPQAQQLGADAREDARLQGGCRAG
ncbi:LCP family protein [Nocardioides gansuensis]|uniref:LCP family protein n=1 Tax=Nocardioides gansuensis TaxID=2138300 RepID=UPI001401F80D|nr:LCP family protein [Nocardioides gansuensis]